MGWPIFDALKGLAGNFEVNRVVGAFGAVSYVVCANVFVGWDVMVKGRIFDLTSYCLAFPAGLAASVAAIAGAVAVKDRAVAAAEAVRSQTAQSNLSAGAGAAAGGDGSANVGKEEK